MTIRVALEHRTSYTYNRLIELGSQLVRLRPCMHARTPIFSYAMDVTPSQHFCNWHQDPHGNFQARLVFPEKVKKFEVSIHLVVDLVVFNPFDFFIEDYCEEWPFTYQRSERTELRSFLSKRKKGNLFSALVESIDQTKRRTIDFLVEMNALIKDKVEYTIRMEPGVQTPEKTLQLGSGSCRDSAWLLVQVLRHCGVAARFVSGYLIQLKADKSSVDGPDGTDVDFCDLHAWAEAYVPGAGWIGLDPTSGLLAGEGHIPLACSPDPKSAAPITGTHERCKVTFEHHMSVRRLEDYGRAGRPYRDEDWQAIDECGALIDQQLDAHDVRLTLGGEPTFVYSRDPDADEWNTAALGSKKSELGDQLLRKLAGLWAPGAVLQHGQGKWYPGEELPRWAYHCVWRGDGEPLWQHPELLAETGQTLGQGIADGERLLQAIAQELRVDEEAIFPAFEDPWYYSWRERQLPSNVDPLKSNLDDKMERERLTKVFTQRLGSAVGHILPLREEGQGWQTGSWFLAHEHCFLLPGDSPLGFRLPLDSQPWIAKEDRNPFLPVDPTQDFTPPAPRVPKRIWPGENKAYTEPEQAISATEIVRTAISIEPRDGILRVFLPPLESGEAFIELVEAVERAAFRCQYPIQLEGYPAPHSPQLKRMAITPDPGVLEVNVPPVDNWSDQVAQFQTLYEECHNLHLAADKFEVDGRHIGTGGGCHVVVGGAQPADSPWLRRPEVLASLLAYWVNHPSLTYVFSGGFVGPTSQAPRIDEARQDAIAELELALAQISREQEEVPPWLVDRVLRHILVDVTGNTHRTEICIDKLYNPDSPSGRLGLVEFRSFEMPPHWQMAAAQNLLIRGLISRFWQQPLVEPLARWGTLLQDKWMLPRYLDMDLQSVCAELQGHDVPIHPEWFKPHSDFRMPVLGSFIKDGVEVELRQAIEPWHVLGEESAAGGQARYVDSSCERIQVLVRGARSERHRLACNGYEVPLQPTGIADELVAGIRYRAWQPPSCLHPTLPINSPLHFDLYDELNGQALAGGTYHVMHPGGRASDTRPINSFEAEGRRSQRFEAAGHRGGVYRPRIAPTLPEAPHTLDLRRCQPLS